MRSPLSRVQATRRCGRKAPRRPRRCRTPRNLHLEGFGHRPCISRHRAATDRQTSRQRNSCLECHGNCWRVHASCGQSGYVADSPARPCSLAVPGRPPASLDVPAHPTAPLPTGLLVSARAEGACEPRWHRSPPRPGSAARRADVESPGCGDQDLAFQRGRIVRSKRSLFARRSVEEVGSTGRSNILQAPHPAICAEPRGVTPRAGTSHRGAP